VIVEKQSKDRRRERHQTAVAFRFTSTNSGLGAGGANAPLAFGKCPAFEGSASNASLGRLPHRWPLHQTPHVRRNWPNAITGPEIRFSTNNKR